MHPSVLVVRWTPTRLLPRTLQLPMFAIVAMLALTACDQMTGPDTQAEELQLSTSVLELEMFGDTAQLQVLRNKGGEHVVLREGITWSVDNPLIATVSDAGLVTARNKGQTLITATSPIGVTRAHVRVKKPRTLDISPKSDTIDGAGKTLDLTAQVTNTSGKVQKDAMVSWKSLDEDVASVDASGTVLARSAGDVRVVAAHGRWADTAYIRVRGGAAVTLDPASGTLEPGATIHLDAVATSLEGEVLPSADFDWSSSDESIATVDQNGKITALAQGEVEITAALSGGESGSTTESSSTSAASNRRATAQLTVLPPGRQSVDVSPQADTVDAVGDELQLTATAHDRKTGEVIPDALITWMSLNPGVAMVDSVGRVVARALGVALITASAGSKADTATIQVGDLASVSQPAPAPPSGSSVAELPRVYVDTEYREPSGRVIEVRAGDNLQAAINEAQPGDILELEAGATFRGNFVLPDKDGTGWIVIRSSAMAQLPGEGMRVSPDDAGNMPRIVSPNRDRAIEATAGAGHYRLMGLEVTVSQDQTESTAIVRFPDGATNLILDRVYVHGHPQLDFRRCVLLNADASAVINSYISECHSSGFDSQAILIYKGNGPFKIANNYLEGAGENVMIGGARPSDGVVPSDIEIRGNYVRKPLAWKDPDRWSVKNLFEVKFGRRILVDGNVFENNWADSQAGTAIVLKHATQNQDWPWTVSEDITFRNNVVRNTRSGISLSSAAEPAMRRLLVENNRFEVDTRAIQGFSGVSDVHLVNNTFVSPEGGRMSNMLILEDGGLPGLVLAGNLWGPASYGLGIGSNEGIRTLNDLAPGWRVSGNAFTDRDGTRYPSGNYFPGTLSAAQQISNVGANVAVLNSVIATTAP